jgi:hypothetical protein
MILQVLQFYCEKNNLKLAIIVTNKDRGLAFALFVAVFTLQSQSFCKQKKKRDRVSSYL